MTASQTFEIEPASPGKHAVRVMAGLTDGWKQVALQVENAEGETVMVYLTTKQAMDVAGTLQGYALLCR